MSVCDLETTTLRRSRPALRCCATEKLIYSLTAYSVQWIKCRLDVLRRVIQFPAKERYFLFKASKLALVPNYLALQCAPVFLSPRPKLPGSAAYHSQSFNAEAEWQNCNLQFPKRLQGVLWNNFTSTCSDCLCEIRMHCWRKYVGYSESKDRLRISLAHPPNCHFAHVQWLPVSIEKPQTPFREIRDMFTFVPVLR